MFLSFIPLYTSNNLVFVTGVPFSLNKRLRYLDYSGWDFCILECFLIQKMLTSWAICTVLFFRFMRRHAPICCPISCVNTFTIWQKSLQKNFMLIVRYTSKAINLCYTFTFLCFSRSYFLVTRVSIKLSRSRVVHVKNKALYIS